ncbi:DUF6973 domain-containing protein [Erwinia aphidicola]|uniref:DUF6973 domain-containing protein n=1 Tax=Erwinia aphidicola TaxID=68334 RepID=UPI003D220F68
MLAMMDFRKISLSVADGLNEWRTKNILTQNTDFSGKYLVMTKGDIDSATDAAQSTQVWKIITDKDTGYDYITTLDEKSLTVNEPDLAIHPISLESLDKTREDQQWIATSNINQRAQFESIAFPGTFLAKIPGINSEEIAAVVSPKEESLQYVLTEWNIVDTNIIIYNTARLWPTQLTPAIEYSNVDVDLQDSSHIFYPSSEEDDKQSTMTIRFSIPPEYIDNEDIVLFVSLKSIGTVNSSDQQPTMIDVSLNGSSLMSEVPIGLEPSIFQIEIPYNQLSTTNDNTLVVTQSNDSGGVYRLYGFSFELMGQPGNKSLASLSSDHDFLNNFPGLIYNKVKLDDVLRPGNPYLKLSDLDAEIIIYFSIPDKLATLKNGYVTIFLNHTSITNLSTIEILLNDSIYLDDYQPPENDFIEGVFSLPFDALITKGINSFSIKLSQSSATDYLLSDVKIVITSSQPEVNESNYESTVKSWILNNRKNIAELSQIPRDDLSAMEFLIHAPAWFYLPYLPISPTELAVLIKHFPLNFYFIAMEVKEINGIARRFHTELISTDLPRKNALRHSLWMALLTREYDDEFALDLGNAHEEAHIDLTIEGPFDHVTDKINNMVGIQLSKSDPDQKSTCEELVEGAWNNNQLAWVRNFREEDGEQIADIFWQEPLNSMAKKFKVLPIFNDLELATLNKFNITLPTIGHDEL